MQIFDTIRNVLHRCSCAVIFWPFISTLLLTPAAAQECTSGQYIYKMINKDFSLSASLTAVLRKNSPTTRKEIGHVPNQVNGAFIKDGAWVATFYLDGKRIFSVSKYSSQTSNYRHDITVYFNDGTTLLAPFDFIALSNRNNASIEYDLLNPPEAAPDQILLTIDGFKSVLKFTSEEKIDSAKTEEQISEFKLLYSHLAANLNLASGAWIIDGCAND